jgi:hypothetical protein
MPSIIKKIWSDDVTELTDRFKRIKSSDRMNTDYFVFKCNEKLIDRLIEDARSRNELINRSSGKPIYLLNFSPSQSKYLLTQITLSGLTEIHEAALVRDIRDCDLNEVIERSHGDCFLTAPKDSHFITPSGKHTTKFLRLNDAIYSYNALDRISFWLQLQLQDCAAVVIDTWSLSSIILQTLQLLETNIPFNCFHKHITKNRKRAIETLNKLSRRIEGDKPILFLVGISSSGEFFKALPKLLEDSNIQNPLQSLSIFGFSDTPKEVNILCRLATNAEWFDADNCKHCKDPSRAVTYEIDSKYYYPRKYEERPVRFSKNLLLDEITNNRSRVSEFIHKYGSSNGVLAVHKDDLNDGVSPRHHTFSIDVSSLMMDVNFTQEIVLKLEQIEYESGAPDLVIFPPHRSGYDVVKFLRKRWKNTSFLSEHYLSNSNDQLVNELKRSRHICFVDDVIISGSRINNYLRSLREEFVDGAIDTVTKVSWFPLIARPISNLALDKLSDSLSGHDASWENHFYYLYKIILPDWSASGECPWCEEERLLANHVGPIWDPPSWYKNRRAKLKNIGIGITEDALLTRPIAKKLTLGAASPLGDEGLSDVQVIFLLANGLQLLRNKGDSSLGLGDLFYQNKLFWEAVDDDHRSGTFDRYTEPFIQACFLRVVKTSERSVTNWGHGKTKLESRVSRGECNDLIGEYLFFLLRSSSENNLSSTASNYIRSIANDAAIELILDAVDVK